MELDHFDDADIACDFTSTNLYTYPYIYYEETFVLTSLNIYIWYFQQLDED